MCIVLIGGIDRLEKHCGGGGTGCFRTVNGEGYVRDNH